MKSIMRELVLGFCFLATQRAEAQLIPQTVILLTGVELRQNETVDKNGVSTTKAPTRLSFSAETLLEDLARDETTNGTWFAHFDNKVPTGAKLKLMYASPDDLTNLTFEVVHGDDVVEVSNILSATPADANYIADVAFIDATGTSEPPYYSIIFRRYTLTYDARPVGDALHFTITGMATVDLLGGKPNAKGIYTEEEVFGLGYGFGAGVDSTGTPFMLENVNMAATGKESLTDPGAVPAAYSGSSLDAVQAAGPPAGFGASQYLGGSGSPSALPPTLGIQSFQLTPPK